MITVNTSFLRYGSKLHLKLRTDLLQIRPVDKPGEEVVHLLVAAQVLPLVAHPPLKHSETGRSIRIGRYSSGSQRLKSWVIFVISDSHLGSAVLAGCVIFDTLPLTLFSTTQCPQFQPQAPQSDPIPSFLEHLQGFYVVSNLRPESLQSTRWPPQAELISQCVSWYTSGRTHSETEERIWVNPCTSCGAKSRNKKGYCVHHKKSCNVEFPRLLKPYISLLFHCIPLQNRH